MANYNWSPEFQTWFDLLNTLISQASPTPDEFDDASPLHRRAHFIVLHLTNMLYLQIRFLGSYLVDAFRRLH
jgi:hypothetical protein